ncbi:MAG: hypothetical protein AB7O28_12905 [Vicinamibacterales bacterium]
MSARSPLGPWMLAAAYVAATLVFARPLLPELRTSIAADYGDSLFTAWIMAWVAQHLTALLHGDLGAWTAMWDLRIFAPEHGTLTYSEHFIGQTLQVLPLTWVVREPLLAFNVVFLATFAMTGLGAHLLTRQLSGSHRAGAVAGLTCMFSEYRVIWSSHLHMLSIHWWLFALWAIDRFVATRSRRALAGATASLVMLHLSSNYLMAYCAPFTAGFAIWSLARHGRMRDGRVWALLTAAGAASVLVVLPLMLRYLATRAALGVTRSTAEIAASSASIDSYARAWPWFGPLLALAVTGAAVARRHPDWPSRSSRLALLGLALMAMILSFGPVVQVGRASMPGPYQLLLSYVPGFAGLRVAERFGVIAFALCSVLAGFGAVWLSRWRVGAAAAALATVLAIRPAFATPFVMNREVMAADQPPRPGHLRPGPTPPAIYRFARTLPPDAVLAEFPFGVLGYEILYSYFTLVHDHRTINGYSGVLPASFLARVGPLHDPLVQPDRAWAALAPATHVIVHPAAWADDTGDRIRAWLESRGATVAARADGAWLYALPVRASTK